MASRRTPWGATITVIGMSAVLFACPAPALAVAIDLDPSFGTGGKVITDFGPGWDTARAVALQSDGKIVVVGSGSDAWALARYNTDGSLDASFDGDGKVTTDIDFYGEAVAALAIQVDGKIVVAGAAGLSALGGCCQFALVRYNTDGSLDTSFDADGVVTTMFDGSAGAGAVAVQADGRIVAVGSTYSWVESGFALARYQTDGSLDTSFDGDGKVVTTFGGASAADTAAGAMAIQADGKVVAAGRRQLQVGVGRDSALARYNTDGSLDTSFGEGGLVTTSFDTSDDTIPAIAIQADAKIVAAVQGGGVALARYNADGSIDTSFGADGSVTTPGLGSANGVAVQKDAQIVVVGRSSSLTPMPPYPLDFALARFDADGQLDGMVTTDFGGIDTAYDVAIQADGKLVVVGQGANDWALARYLAPLDLTPPELILPEGIVVDGLAPPGTPVDFVVTAEDDRDGTVPVTCTPPSGSTFPLGLTSVQCTATDAAGNTSEGVLTVYVRLLITRSTVLTRDYLTTIVVGADGITLDCAGHTLAGPGEAAPDSNGALVEGRSGVTVRRCDVRGFVQGIQVTDSNHVTLDGNSASANIANGLVVARTSESLIKGNSATANAGVGLLLEGVVASTIRDNVASHNGYEGVLLIGSTDNTLTRNTASENGSPEVYAGFALLGGSSGNNLRENTATGNGDVGFVLEESHENVLAGNVGNGNGLTGFEVRSGSTANTLSGNVSIGNASHGYLLTDSAENVLDRNTAQASGSEGFLLVRASKNTLRENTANRNGSAGIDLREWSNENILTGNTANLNEDGIRVFAESNGNVLTGNTADRNRSFGFPVFDNSSGNQLIGNTANRNMSCGLAAMWGATNNLFRDNVAQNTIDGMDIWDEVPGLNAWEDNQYKTICTGPDC